MARRSLRPQLNQIRSWVRQGRTDAWIAHQLEVTTQQIAAFRREHRLTAEDLEANGADFDDEIDLRAEDDALIAAELEAAEKERAKAEAAKKRRSRKKAAEPVEDVEADGDDGDERPRRRRRGGRRGKGRTSPFEATFDHGEEGYGLWLDPAVQDDPVYAEHWAGHRPVEVTIEEDRIVITRVED